MSRKNITLFLLALLGITLLAPLLGQAQPPQRIRPFLIEMRSRHVEAAKQEFEKIEPKMNEDELSWIIEGIRYLYPTEEWLPILEKITEANPENAEIAYLLARTYWRVGDEETALLYCQETFARDSQQPKILYGIAALAFAMSKYDLALKWVGHLRQVAPGYYDGHFLQGTIYARQGKNEEALKLLQQVINVDPQYTLAYFEIGKIYNRQNEPKQAESYLKKAVEQQPFFAEAYNALIIALARQNKHDEIREYQKIVQYLNTWPQDKLNRIHHAFKYPNEVPPRDSHLLVTELLAINKDEMAKGYLEYRYENLSFSDPLRMQLAQLRYNAGEYLPTLILLNEIQTGELQDSEDFAVLRVGSLIKSGQSQEAQQALQAAIKQFPDSEPLQQFHAELRQEESAKPTNKNAAPSVTPQPVKTENSQLSRSITFVNVAEKAGLSGFQHRLGHPDKPWITDAMGSGVSVGDYDGDDDDDLYFVNGRPKLTQPNEDFRNALFRNNGDGTFTDVTQKAGGGDTGFGMCAVFGDIDNDGDLDLFIGNVGPNALYRNNGDGTFTDVSEQAGVNDSGYAAAAAFADFNRDGSLDLFVGNYVDFDPEKHADVRMDYYGQKVFMGPLHFPHQPDKLYFNDGEGRFTDVSQKAGINPSEGRAMGVAVIDLHHDGWLDLYVTNDSTYNHVLKNKGDGTFEDISFPSGGAFTESGMEGASMGVAPGDVNNDGFQDIYITSYEKQPDVLFTVDEGGFFVDNSGPAGLMAPSRMLITWGVNLADFDADGWLDVITANGHMYPQVSELDLDREYNQGMNVYRNTGQGKFDNVTKTTFPQGMPQVSARGSALIDYDQDGDRDVVVNNIDAQPILLENRTQQGHWLQVKLSALSAHTYGTRIVAEKGDHQWTRSVDGGSGYLSQNSSWVHFGFGEIDSIDRLIIHWPQRDPQIIEAPKLNQRITIPLPQ